MQNTNVQRFPNTGFHPSSRLSNAHISIFIPGNAFAHSSMQNVNPECYSGANTIPVGRVLGLFVCGISFLSGQLFNELFPDCTRSCFSQVILRRRGGDHIYEMRCLFVAVGPNARFIVLPHWDNMS